MVELSPETMAAFRDARRSLEDRAGHGLDDDELVRMLAHHALGGPGGSGRAAYQVAMTVCEACGRAARDGAGRAHPVEAADAEAALCDAQVLPATRVGRPIATATQTIPPRIRRAILRREHGRCCVPGCRASRFLEVHHIVPRSRGGTHDPANLVVLCSAHHGRVHDGSLRLIGQAPEHLAFEWRAAIGPVPRFGHRAISRRPASSSTAPRRAAPLVLSSSAD